MKYNQQQIEEAMKIVKQRIENPSKRTKKNWTPKETDNAMEIVRERIEKNAVFVHVTNLPTEKPKLSKKVKVGSYLGKPRIVLQNKILFKCGFNFGVNIRFKKIVLPRKEEDVYIRANRYIIRTTHHDSNNAVSKVKNHGVDLPTIDMKRGLENVFTSGSKVLVEYFDNKIIIEEV